MRIVFDAYELIPGKGKSIGVYNYAKNLLQALSQVIDANTEMCVICNSTNISDFICDNSAVTNFVVSGGEPGKIQRLEWIFGRAAWVTKNLNADVYFSPKGFLPKGISFLSPNIKTVIVSHDLIPLWYAENYPGYFGRLEEVVINRLMTSGIKSANRVIAISSATANDIRLRLGRTLGIFVVPNGIPITRPGERPFNGAYIFAMASALPHKNAEGLIAAYRVYRSLVDQPLPLIVCGISDPNETGVMVVKGIDDTKLHAYYAYADLFIFLSLIEGFGFPPIEALAHGTSVICSDILSLREVAKDLATFVPPCEADKVAKAMVEVLSQVVTDDIKKRRMVIVDDYTWHSCAKGVLEAILST